MRKRKTFKHEEERRHPDSPDGLVYISACNKQYGLKLIEAFKLAKAGVKKDGRR